MHHHFVASEVIGDAKRWGIMLNAKVVAIFISAIAGEKMEEVEIAEAIAGAGLAGDRYSTGEGSFNRKRQGRRQVTLINSIFFRSSGFEYNDSRRNIVTPGRRTDVADWPGVSDRQGAFSRTELLRSMFAAYPPFWQDRKVFRSIQ
jgi:hypothetical protein